jgi:putrescine---pyruvate transaminase
MTSTANVLIVGAGPTGLTLANELARRGAGVRIVDSSDEHAYHGMNAYGTSLGGIPANTEAFDPLVTLVQHVPWDDAAALEKVIKEVGADQVAAFFCEPVVGAGGVYFPPDGYLARVQEICRQHDVLFVVDEVITGFGRTGAWFASERFSLTPDLVTVAKGLTSGYGSTRGLARSGPLV